MDILLHTLEKRSVSDHWPHFQHFHLGKLGKHKGLSTLYRRAQALTQYLVSKTSAILEAGLTLRPS